MTFDFEAVKLPKKKIEDDSFINYFQCNADGSLKIEEGIKSGSFGLKDGINVCLRKGILIELGRFIREHYGE